MKANVVAVIVTFFPDMLRLNALIGSISGQVDTVVVIDNGSLSEDQEKSLTKRELKLVCLHDNIGIGAAQNRGIAIAQEKYADFVLILDQDSVPSTTMVGELISAYCELSKHCNVAALGPAYDDVGNSFVKLSGLSLKRVSADQAGVVAVDHLISSGTLISLRALSRIGFMNEHLFIDLVDTEWSIRARQSGYTLWGVGSAHMEHNLGERKVEILGRSLPQHKPFRYYYIVRNGLILTFSDNIPFRWRLVLLLRTLKIALVFSLFAPNAYANFKMILRGTKDALLSRRGRLGGY